MRGFKWAFFLCVAVGLCSGCILQHTTDIIFVDDAITPETTRPPG